MLKSPDCMGCGKPLLLENAWMLDGCPCNTRAGINDTNQTRWGLLMQLQQAQSYELQRLRSALHAVWSNVPALEPGENFYRVNLSEAEAAALKAALDQATQGRTDYIQVAVEDYNGKSVLIRELQLKLQTLTQTVEARPVVSLAQAKKFFHDWLDKTRPWAQPGGDAYSNMERVVAAAARYFANDCPPTKEQVDKLNGQLLRITKELDEHPADYDGPCCCPDCLSDG